MAKATINLASAPEGELVSVAMVVDGETIHYGAVENGGELEYDDDLPELTGPIVVGWVAPPTSEEPEAPAEPAEPEVEESVETSAPAEDHEGGEG